MVLYAANQSLCIDLTADYSLQLVDSNEEIVIKTENGKGIFFMTSLVVRNKWNSQIPIPVLDAIRIFSANVTHVR